jgi:hypothetical protein
MKISTPGFDITERCTYFAYTMTQSIDQLHLLVLNVGLAIHNADWNWQK